MEDSTEVQVSPKKIKKSRWGPVTENDSPIKKDDDESEKVIPNGTGNVSSENLQEDDIVKEKPKTVKISKISKSATTGQKSPHKESSPVKPQKVEKTPTKPQKEELAPLKVNSPSDSPTSSQYDNGFHGFESVVLSEQQSAKQDALHRILAKLNALDSKKTGENLGEAGASGSQAVDLEVDSEEGHPEDEMTVDTGHASDSDSDQMEIDMGNDKENSSRADSVEFSDRQSRAKDSDVDIMETDSVKSAGKVNKRNRKGTRKSSVTDVKGAKSSILESTLKGTGNAKVEYCGGCEEEVDDAEDGICCDGKCERWFHLRCSGLSQAEYEELGRDENAKWACNKCSGKTPSPTKQEGKPLLTVRKDLTKVITPPLPAKRKSVSKETVTKTPKIDISNPAYLKPFDFGWKRELVFRNASENNRRQGDVYYYTPKGKKLRSLREISDYLEGTDLTQDNFTFWKEPLGIEDPEKEIIRDAKFKALNSKDSTLSPPLPKKITATTPKLAKTPKTPTPKLTATVTPLESPASATVTPVASALTPASASPVVAKASASVTPRVVLKGKTTVGSGPKFKATPSKATTPGQAQKIVISKGNEKKTVKENSRSIGKSNKQHSHKSVRSGSITAVNNETKIDGNIEKTKNNFRRYGLLANAKTPRKKIVSSSSSSSSSSESSDSNCSSERRQKRKKHKLSYFPRPRVIEMVPRQGKAALVSQLELKSRGNPKVHNFSPSETDKTHGTKKDTGSKPVDPFHALSLPSSPDPSLLEPSKIRPSPPEIQFRPSNPSTYGCQTNVQKPYGVSMSGPSSSLFHTNLVNCSSGFETVLIVDTSTETFMSSTKGRDKSPLILNNSDCSLEIISVESLNADPKHQTVKYDSGYLLPSPVKQTSSKPIKKTSFSRMNRTQSDDFERRRDIETSPVSGDSSGSTEEFVVVDDDPGDNSSPPFLMRNSPPPKLTRNISVNRSPPNLQPIQSPPPLQQFYPRSVLPSLSGSRPKPSTSLATRNALAGTIDTTHADKKKKASSDDEELEMGMLPPTWEHPKPKDNKLRTMDVCSIRCLPAMGLIPTLQCHVCLCLYHPECVGLEEANHRTIHCYKCKNCQMEKPKPPQSPTGNGAKPMLSPPPLTPISSLSTSTPSPSITPLAPPKLQRITDGKPVSAPRGRAPSTKATSIVGGVTTWLPPSSTIQLRPTPPPLCKMSPSQKPVPPTATPALDSANSQPVQTLVSMDCKRYIVVPKHNVLSVSPATTSSVQVANPVNTHITTAASDSTSTVSALTPQSYGPGGLILPKPQVTTSTAILVNSSTSTTSSFQNPPGVILLPYITPQTSPTPKDGQPQYIVVNGPSGLQPGNFIFGNIPQQQPLKLPTVPTSQPAEPILESAGVKRPLERVEHSPPAKRAKTDAEVPSPVMQNFLQNVNHTYKALLHAFQYLKVQELLRASRVCHMWRDMALHKSLWESVRMKNSHVKDWEGFSGTLRRTGTRHLDLRKMIMPDKPEPLKAMWGDCIKALSKVTSLVRLELCRCVSSVLEQIVGSCPQLEAVIAVTIKSNQLDLENFKNCQNLTELKLKSLSGIELTNVTELGNLSKLKHLSLTTVKNIKSVLEVVGKMTQLESLELGEFTSVPEDLVIQTFSQLTRLRKLRLEKGQQECPTDTIFQTISKLPSLIQLELINFDVKVGFDESLGLCTNIKMLLIIPTYVTQSATTNHLVIEGVSKLTKTLNHFTWGLTLELLRVTDLFIDQWEAQKKSPDSAVKSPTPNQAPQKKSSGDSIPILKPSNKDGKKSKESGVTQVDVLQLPKLHKVLSTILPNTKIVILKVPFSATWRQSLCSTTQ